MLIKPDTTGTNSSATMPGATACGNCGAEERRLIHHVRHRGIFRLLCTSCVLRLHPQSFCPTCFQVYPPPPSNDAVLTCFKCYSSSHSHCVESGGPTSPSSPYICPLCIQPNTPIFKLKSEKETDVGINEAMNMKSSDFRVMDRDSAKKLLAAAKIASFSMNKAAVAAKAEAERRAKEATYTRKRAKEALEYVAHLVMKEKLRKKELGLAAGSSGVGINVGYTSGGGGVKNYRENNNNVKNVSTSYRNRNVGSVLGRPMAVDGKIGSGGNMDNSNQVLAALNAVGLKENENMRGALNVAVDMDVDGEGRMVSNAGEADGGLVGEGNNNDGGGGGDCVNLADMESGVENVDAQGWEIEDDDDDDDEVDLVQFVEDQMENKEDSHGGEQHANGPQL